MQLERQNHRSSVEFNLSLLKTFYCLLTEEGGILEPSKILNEEFYRMTTKNLLLKISKYRAALLVRQSKAEQG